MKNQEVAALFEKMGQLLEIKGEVVFKVRAYFKAAEVIKNLPEAIEEVAAEGRLSSIAGVGKTLAAKIEEFLNTGRLEAYERLIQEVPEGVLEVRHVPSVGPKKAKLFFQELKVNSLALLKQAAQDGRLLTLPGIQIKTVEKILEGIEIVEAGQQRMNLGEASESAQHIISQLKGLPEVACIEYAGSLRRGCVTIGDIDILVASAQPSVVMAFFAQLPGVQRILVQGERKTSVLMQDNLQVDLRVVSMESFGAALLYFTGSKWFNIRLRQMARNRDLKINEYGIFTASEERVAGATEKSCLRALGLTYIAPELREELDNERILKENPSEGLITLSDMQGEFHVHSTWSDGKNTIAEMVDAARARGYHYLAISDHSQKLKVAHGVSLKDLKKKKTEIDELNQRYDDFWILFGSEVEIDNEGCLDYNEDILREFDFVIGAIHTGFTQTEAQLTHRFVKACGSGLLHAIAHPTGIHIGKRNPYPLNFNAVCEAAVAYNVCLEINSCPVRLDLNGENAYWAKQRGVKFVINTDAHIITQLNHMVYGVTMARRGWLTKQDVLNTLSLTALKKFLHKDV